MVLPTKKLPASTANSKLRLQKTDLGELQSTPTKPPPPSKTPPSSTVTASMILILLALLSVLYACPNQEFKDGMCARVSEAQEWAAPHLAFTTPYLQKMRTYMESIDDLGAPYLAHSQDILREVWERNIEPHICTIWDKVQRQSDKGR